MDPSNPLGASSAPEIAKLYEAGYGLSNSRGIAGAKVAQAQDEKEAAAAAAALAEKKKADLANIKAYKVVKKSDGGFDFFDPDGQQVDIATLAERTGENAASILHNYGSENPIDQQYVQDYSNLQDFIQSVLSGDAKKVKAFTDAKPELKQYNDKDGINRLVKDFKTAYQRFYVPRSVNPQAWGANVPQEGVVSRLAFPGSQYVESAGGPGVGVPQL